MPEKMEGGQYLKTKTFANVNTFTTQVKFSSQNNSPNKAVGLFKQRESSPNRSTINQTKIDHLADKVIK
jgi:hypothetical protein